MVLARIPPWRHYDSTMARLDRMDARHEHDFQELFARLGDLEDVVAVVREQPEAIALGQLRDAVRRMEADARAHQAHQRQSWATFMQEMSAAAQQFGDASNRVYWLAQRMIDEAS